MASSYTPILRLTLPTTGELQGTWGDTVNNGITSLTEAAIAGTAAVVMSDANHTLTVANGATDEARRMFVTLTGALTATRNVICPAVSKMYVVRNSTTGGQSIVFKTSAGTGITVANGQSAFLYCDGTNVVEAFSAFAGNAGSATVLQTPRTLWGQNFNGSANVSGALSGVTDITASGNVTLSAGTANGVMYLNGSKVVTTGSALTFDGANLAIPNGNLGIGASTSGKYLVVFNGDAVNAQQIQIRMSGTNALIDATRFSGTTPQMLFAIDSTEQMRLTSTGLGIGTSSPGAKLDVQGGNILVGTTTAGNSTASMTFGKVAAGGGTINNRISLATYGGLYGAYMEAYADLSASTATYLAFGTTAGGGGSPTERMRLDASGNLGLGTSTITGARLKVSGASAGGAIMSEDTTGSTSFVRLLGDASSQNLVNWQDGTALRFATSTQSYGTFTERMRIDSSGNLMVAKTSPSDGVVGSYISAGGTISTTRSESTNAVVNYVLYSTGAANYRFYVGMGGTIFATSTSISGLSDASLKENVRDLETGLPQVMALRPRRFDWKNGDGKDVAGFVAQEVAEVLPELVTEYVYGKNEAGDDVLKKSLKMGDMLPTLVKAIQELKSIVDAQAERIAQLEQK